VCLGDLFQSVVLDSYFVCYEILKHTNITNLSQINNENCGKFIRSFMGLDILYSIIMHWNTLNIDKYVDK
jgi:hypothetical protein